MEPFAFVVCAPLCLMQPPKSGQSREACLHRMEVTRAEKPEARAICMTLNPNGEVIDSAGLPRTQGPAANYRATMVTRLQFPDGTVGVTNREILTISECENRAVRHMAEPRRDGKPYAISVECLPHYTDDTLRLRN